MTADTEFTSTTTWDLCVDTNLNPNSSKRTSWSFAKTFTKNGLLQFYIFSLVMSFFFFFFQFTKRTAAPNSYAELSVDDDVQKSKVPPESRSFLVMLAGVSQQTLQWNVLRLQVVYSSKDPVWEEGFTFFVHSVKRQQLCVQVCQLSSYIAQTCLCDSGTWLLLKILLFQ